MAVILRTLLAGPDGAHQPGTRLELSEQAERELVEGGYAVFDKAPRGETATIGPRENAARQTGRGKR
jgi:hypothetical protein